MGDAACGYNKPLISVVVPVYKVEPYLRKCVDSILGQTYRNLEIILVDDGSPDGCPAICDEYAEKDRRVKVIHKSNGGVAEARNAGISVVKGKYLVFVDSDDWIGSNYLEKLYNSIGDYSWGISGITYCTNYENQSIMPTLDLQQLVKSSLFGYTCNKIYLFEKVRNIRFNQSIREDLTYNLEVYLKSYRYALCETAEYYYYQHDSSTLHTKKTFDDEKVLLFLDNLSTLTSQLPKNANNIALFNYAFLSAISDQFVSLSLSKIPFREKLHRINLYTKSNNYKNKLYIKYADNTLYKMVMISYMFNSAFVFLLLFYSYLILRKLNDKCNRTHL